MRVHRAAQASGDLRKLECADVLHIEHRRSQARDCKLQPFGVVLFGCFGRLLRTQHLQPERIRRMRHELRTLGLADQTLQRAPPHREQLVELCESRTQHTRPARHGRFQPRYRRLALALPPSDDARKLLVFVAVQRVCHDRDGDAEQDVLADHNEDERIRDADVREFVVERPRDRRPVVGGDELKQRERRVRDGFEVLGQCLQLQHGRQHAS